MHGTGWVHGHLLGLLVLVRFVCGCKKDISCAAWTLIGSSAQRLGPGFCFSFRAMVSMQAPLQAPDTGRETMLTDIWETPEVLRRLLHLG